MSIKYIAISKIERTTDPSSASLIAGAKASATVIFPEPNNSIVSTQAAVHPGTVTLYIHPSQQYPQSKLVALTS